MDRALARAADWMAAVPVAELRFDAALGLHGIVDLGGGDEFLPAYERARSAAARDDDHPLHRLWNPAHRTSSEVTTGWAVPAAGDPRVNVNRVMIEAVHCAENGLRPETLAYLGGPMRDDGGYQTAHALWSLLIASANGCVPSERFHPLRAELAAELRAAQPAELAPATTLAVDLYAERALMVLLAGARDAEVGGWIAQLLAHQDDDGSWGVADGDEPAEFRYHATMVTAWALCAWRGEER